MAAPLDYFDDNNTSAYHPHTQANPGLDHSNNGYATAEDVNDQKHVDENTKQVTDNAHSEGISTKPQTRLRDLPLNIRKGLPTGWSWDKGINDYFCENRRVTPLIWALRGNNSEIINYLFTCKDLDLNKSTGDNCHTPLSTCIQYPPNSEFFRRLLTQGADPKIQYCTKDYHGQPTTSRETVLDVMMGRIDISTFTLSNDKISELLSVLLDYIAVAIYPVPDLPEITHVSHIKDICVGSSGYIPDIFKLICEYVAQPANLQDFSAYRLTENRMTWIKQTAELCFLMRIEEENAQKANNKAVEEMNATATASLSKVLGPTTESGNKQNEIDILKASVLKQAAEIERLSGEMEALKKLVAPASQNAMKPKIPGNLSGFTGHSLANLAANNGSAAAASNTTHIGSAGGPALK